MDNGSRITNFMALLYRVVPARRINIKYPFQCIEIIAYSENNVIINIGKRYYDKRNFNEIIPQESD